MRITADVAASGSVLAEVLNEAGQRLEASQPVRADVVAGGLRWLGSDEEEDATLSQRVVLRFTLHRAKLFAVHLDRVADALRL